MRCGHFFSLVAVAILLDNSVVMAIGPYAVTDLGDLPGGEEVSPATGINSFAQVVGQSDVAGGAVSRAYLWTPNAPHGTTGSMVELGPLPGPSSGRSEAAGINGIGQVAGASGNPFHAFLWSPTTPNGTTGSVVDLGDLPGGVDTSFARGINSLGQVVGEGGAATAPRASCGRLLLRTARRVRCSIWANCPVAAIIAAQLQSIHLVRSWEEVTQRQAYAVFSGRRRLPMAAAGP